MYLGLFEDMGDEEWEWVDECRSKRAIRMAYNRAGVGIDRIENPR